MRWAIKERKLIFLLESFKRKEKTKVCGIKNFFWFMQTNKRASFTWKQFINEENGNNSLKTLWKKKLIFLEKLKSK